VAINASGQVAVNAANGSGSYQAFVWKNDGSPLLDLGDFGGYRTFACCINASGQVAGNSSVSEYAHPHAFLWSNDGTGMHDLGTLARGSLSRANALNDSGQVAGWSHTAFYKRQHAFVWMNDGMPMQDLGTFGGTTSLASDINASGQVTGWASLTGDSVTHAFLWRNDGTTKKDLNSLVDPTDPLKAHVTLTRGVFINDSGNILAQGTDSRTGEGLYLLQGTVLTLTPRSIAFGNQRINTASAAKLVTVTNTSSKAVAITGVALSGTASGQFSFTHTCGKSLAAHASCAIKITFRPTSKGAKYALLNVNGGGGGLRSVRLTGNGI
jgi:probable HAF family extracellular repeat protein